VSKKTGHAKQTFRDAGTGETFEGGKDHPFDAGAYANYEAAGLVSAPTVKRAARPKAAPRRASRATAAKPAPVTPPADAAPST